MDHRHWAKSPSSETNPSSPRHFAQPLYSGFRDSEEFQRLPGSLRDIIAGSSASSARRSLHQQPHSLLHLGVPDFEDDTFAALPPPSFMGSVQSNSSITDIARAEVVGSGSEPLNMPTAPRQAPKRKTEATPSESPNKRARTEQISDKSIEEVDLAEEDTALADTLKKQRQQQVAAQEESRKPTKLSKLTCVICLDSPTDLTSTSCGHVFCFQCLKSALAQSTEARRGNCPCCRKILSTNKKGDIIPLEIMRKAAATQPRKAAVVSG